MAMKYLTKVTKQLDNNNWQEKLDLKKTPLEELGRVIKDARDVQKLFEKVEGYLKQVVSARIEYDEPLEISIPGSNELYLEVTKTQGSRAGGLDVDRLLEDYGPEFVEKYRKEASTFDVISTKVKSYAE